MISHNYHAVFKVRFPNGYEVLFLFEKKEARHYKFSLFSRKRSTKPPRGFQYNPQLTCQSCLSKMDQIGGVVKVTATRPIDFSGRSLWIGRRCFEYFMKNIRKGKQEQLCFSSRFQGHITSILDKLDFSLPG